MHESWRLRTRVTALLFAAVSLAVLAPAVADMQTPASSQGYPHFTRVLLLEQTSEDSANVSIGDLNGDAHPDIVLAKGRHGPLRDPVLLNDGHGRFRLSGYLGEADRSYSARLVDLDRDGDLDVVVSNDTPDPKRVYLNDGKANFRAASTYGRKEWPTRNAAIADLNGDHLPDVIAANRTGDGTGANYACLNRGNGQFDAECIRFSQESATTVAAADFTGDGVVDLAVPHRDGGQSHVYVNDGKAQFERRIPFGPPDASMRVAEAADLDGDGDQDIVTIDERRRRAFIFFNERGAAFSAAVPLGDTGVVPYALGVGDANGDGKPDVVVGNIEAPAVVYFNDGTGRHFTPVRFGDKAGAAYGFAIGDLDEDGHPDIAVARSGAPNVVYFGEPSATIR